MGRKEDVVERGLLWALPLYYCPGEPWAGSCVFVLAVCIIVDAFMGARRRTDGRQMMRLCI